MTNTIPQQLITRDQWVTWRHERRGDKPTKIPYIAGTGKRASSTDPTHWRSYETAAADRTVNGIGFVFTDDDPFVGIDLDDCLTEDGTLSEWAGKILDSLPPTYTEISPSGNGLKLFVSGELPNGARNRRKMPNGGQVEIYARGRYFTVTGNRYADTPCVIAQADLKPLHAALFPARPDAAPQPPRTQGGGYGGSNESLVAAIQRSKQAARFNTLWAGDLSGHGEDHSAADQALANILAWWCGPNPKRIDRVFRMSGLYRDKWDREDYRDRTIQNAIAGCTSFYEPEDSVAVNESSEVHSRARGGSPYPFTDIGNAERLTAHFDGRVRHCAKAGGWYIWDGSRWAKDETDHIVYYAIRAVREIWRERDLLTDEEVRTAIVKHANRSESQGRIAAMLKLAASMPGVAIDSSAFDADPWLFNCRNGTVDLRTGQLRPHRAEDNITKISPASYHPHSTCEQWMKFLDRIFHGNTELIEYVQEVLGLCLSGDISEQIMPVFYGDGSNGKSTLLDTVMAVMGSYAGKAAPDLLMARHGEVHPTEIADLWGLRLAVASETEEGRKLRISMVKEMTGDADLKARYMRGDFFNFTRTHKLVLMTNHRPRVTESKNAIWRRLKLVPFTARIEDHERDRQLASKLRSEWTGILSWLVAGCRRWHEAGGLDDPAEVRDATEAYRDDEDPLSEFVSARLEFTEHGFLAGRDLRAAYTEWCRAESVAHPIGERSLTNRVGERQGVKREARKIDGISVRGMSGVRLITGGER